MAAVPITLVGVSTDDSGQARNVTFVGMASITGLGVGGGPMPPGRPPGTIWPDPGPLPHPEHPIAPGGRPPGIWGGPIDPYPGHPLPEPPRPGDKPPDPVTPPVKWKAVWHPTDGWIVVGVIDPSVEHPVPST